MTGKAKIPQWGGARPGAGKKKAEISEELVRSMLRAARKYAKENGKTIDEVLLDIVYTGGPRDRLAAIKIFKDFTMAHRQDKNVTVQDNREPSIYLPEMREDPGKVIQMVSK